MPARSSRPSAPFAARTTRLIACLALVLGGAAVAACAPAPTPPVLGVITPTAPVDGMPVTITDSKVLEDFLEHEGIPLTYLDEGDFAWFEAPGRAYEIGAEAEGIPDSLMVHVHDLPRDARAAADRVAPDGRSVQLPDGEPLKIEWLGSPHLYLSGPLLVVYVGDSVEIMNTLAEALGPQFAGVGPPVPTPERSAP